jgi:hypothetical protein
MLGMSLQLWHSFNQMCAYHHSQHANALWPSQLLAPMMPQDCLGGLS